MTKSRKLIYAALLLVGVWILLLVMVVALHNTLPKYPRWLDFALAVVMLSSAVLLASWMVLMRRWSLGAGLSIGTIVVLSGIVAFGATSGGVLQWLRGGLALATVLALMSQYFRARRVRQGKHLS